MQPKRSRNARSGSAASVSIAVACILSVGFAHAQEPVPERRIRIIEGTPVFPPPDSGPLPTVSETPRHQEPDVPKTPAPAVEDDAFDDLVRSAIDDGRRKLSQTPSGTTEPSAWNPDLDVLDGGTPAPDTSVVAPADVPPPPEVPEPSSVEDAPPPTALEPQRKEPEVVRETVPAAPPPRAYTPPVEARIPVPREKARPTKKRIREPVRTPDDDFDEQDFEDEDPALYPDVEETEMSGIILSDVTIRDRPDKTGEAVGTAKAGTTVEVVECVGWCEIRHAGVRGWVYGTFVDLPEATTPGGR